ncbi:NAD-binding protein, partial [Salmonella enterica]
WLELIADGHHVHPAAMSLCCCCAKERIVLITDAMQAAGMPDGRYTLCGEEVQMHGGVVRTASGGLAGSTVLDAKAPMVMDRNFKPGFRIDLHIKDLANALDTSHGVGAQLPLTAAVMEMMQALRADGLG